MQPYYNHNGITLYCADMREVELPRADLILTDPPYAESTHTGARTCPKKGDDGRWLTGGNEGNALIDFDSITLDELRECFDRIGAAARAWVIATMDYHHIVQFEEYPPAHLLFVRFGIWDKPNGAPQFSGDRPAMGWEGIAHFHRADVGRMHWNGGGCRAVYTHPKINGNHKAAKPPRLIAQLMGLFSQPGDLILDPFCGGGVTLLVARLMKRRAVGIERSERYCEATARWLEDKTALLVDVGRAPTLFDLEMNDAG
jgi:site-specific DNA-methyltransferase (adenine-specific)